MVLYGSIIKPDRIALIIEAGTKENERKGRFSLISRFVRYFVDYFSLLNEQKGIGLFDDLIKVT